MGQLGQGDASNYRPIEEWIERSLVAAQGARRR